MMKVLAKKKTSVARKIVSILVKITLISLFALIPNILPRQWAEYYCGYIYEYVSFVPFSITNMLHFSLTEMLVVVGGIMLLFGVVVFIVKFIKRAASGGLWKYLLNVLCPVLSVVLVVVIFFDLMLGIGYRRYPVSRYFKLEHGEYSYEEYLQVLDWSYKGMVKARARIGEDYLGVGHTSRSFEDNARYANSLIDALALKYEIPMSAAFIRSKPVAGSHVWSMTGIVGCFDPVLAESNINTDYMDITSFPVTLCHEICHAKGLAREGDCNLVASLACIHSKDKEFSYAGYYYIFMNLYPVVKEYAGHEGKDFPDYFSYQSAYPVVRDTNASNAYWDYIHSTAFARFIHDLGTKINNMYLRSNGQKGGVETYHVPDNVYVDFYMTYLKGETND